MGLIDALALVIGCGVLLYLGYALLHPDRF
ncbi:K+-transporting ATPase KdpF subunit [Leucobacter luti]|uniref:K+-transporting ATPase KdpF subunit n=1 Tax=Leucobacter luti TaxID=340320 RepID=A0A4R6RTS9_9MICO|nr:K+-transporting ATPase KdpF subunit [Leucobacter luti]QYM75968.1 potassium-transporting ATPase subunit F [Leucobacter luti]TCK45796.1 K+-transporting ATPase KdpF subunit [Leucobacter luti]TDP90311.1 K+-transporting ATPase KdpF subunit [Leucobacter luti]